jgi:hypothetical protein
VSTTAPRIEYLVGQAQKNRVTYVNGAWQGTADPKEEKAIDTCPQLWDWLNAVGADGWQLTTTQWVAAPPGYQLIFLSRPVAGTDDEDDASAGA